MPAFSKPIHKGFLVRGACHNLQGGGLDSNSVKYAVKRERTIKNISTLLRVNNYLGTSEEHLYPGQYTGLADDSTYENSSKPDMTPLHTRLPGIHIFRNSHLNAPKDGTAIYCRQDFMKLYHVVNIIVEAGRIHFLKCTPKRDDIPPRHRQRPLGFWKQLDAENQAD
jgi:hypothetical protein